MRHYDAGRKISFLIFCWMAALFVVYRPTCYINVQKKTRNKTKRQGYLKRMWNKSLRRQNSNGRRIWDGATWWPGDSHWSFILKSSQFFFFFFFSNKKSPKKIFKKVTVTAKGENLALAKPSPSSFDCWVNLKNKQQLVTGLYFFWCFQMFSFCRSPSGLFGV